ncbi:MAG: WbqC family protein [Algicola sp.]|nr:WbqC family protein [Algicola sp.]
MAIAIMQPYLFPYIGYFQLIHSVEKFVFYDDVNFIKRGWINRNKLLINGKESLFSVPLSKASQNKLIKDIELLDFSNTKQVILKNLEYNYKKAPFFDETYSLVESVFDTPFRTISELAMESITSISHYLELKTIFEVSSEVYAKSRGYEKAMRLITICRSNNCKNYINPAGGKELYNHEYFHEQNVNLLFLENELKAYKQFKNTPIVGLSIIDVLMFNSKKDTQKLIESYKLV